MMPSMAEELALEEAMVNRGIDQFLQQTSRNMEKGAIDSTVGGLRIIKQGLEPLSKAIKAYLDEAFGGKTGRRAVAAPKLVKLEPDIIAYLTIKVLINSAATKQSLQSAAITVATYIEDEIKFRHYEKTNKAHFLAVKMRVQSSKSYDYKRTVLTHAMQTGLQIAWEPWSKTTKLHVGHTCIELLMQSTGLVELLKNGRGVYKVALTKDTLTWIHNYHQRCSLFNPRYTPTIIPPKPWTTPFDGGYYSPAVRGLTLVKTPYRPYLEELANDDMPKVYNAINTIQSTPWRINKQVYAVMETCWDQSMTHGSLPEREPITPRPSPIPPNADPKTLSEEAQAEFKAWKREAACTYQADLARRSKCAYTSCLLWIAKEYMTYEQFYFPYQMDFRGRVYAVPIHLNPQGHDQAKGLLEFAEGKQLGTQQAKDWLAIHGANVYGNDKVDFNERILWVEVMTPTILKIAHDPYNNRQWEDADKPWQFLAFCFEWAGVCRDGLDHVSHIPVALDGSCNGLQHFAAMLRDEVGGKAVNLLPGKAPADIYQAVADRCVAKLKSITGEQEPLAQEWLAVGVNRKLTKRPVMILPYGGTRQSCREYIEDYVTESFGASVCPFSIDMFTATNFMASIVWESIGDVVKSARQAMSWLQTVANLVTKAGFPLQWITPAGLRVLQAYPEMEEYTVKTKMNGKIRKLQILTQVEQSLDKHKQRNGISPNFVHSLDAAALMLYVNKAKAAGIQSFSLIHDSYGTHAADTETSVRCLRDAFVEMYEQNHVLNQLREEILPLLDDALVSKLPPLPELGQLNISDVRESQFFFA